MSQTSRSKKGENYGKHTKRTKFSNSQPFKPMYDDNNPMPQPVDQFAPLLSRKLIKARLSYNARPQSVISKVREPIQTQQTQQQQQPKLIRVSQRRNYSSEFFFEDTGPQNNISDHIRCEECFDSIAAGSFEAPLSQLAENHFANFFNAQKVHFFHDIPSIQLLYGPTLGVAIPYGTGLVGFCHYSKKLLRLTYAEEHNSFNPTYDSRLCPPDSSVLLFPLFSANGSASCVVEVIRNAQFTEDDEQRVQYFQQKFKLYSRWILQPQLPDDAYSDFAHADRYGVFVDRTCMQLTKYFSCKTAELWEYHSNSHELFQLIPGFHEPQFVQIADAGIVAHSLTRQISISTDRCDRHAAFNPKTDTADQSLFVLPVVTTGSPIIYGIALRGKRSPNFFTEYDEKLLARVAPLIFTTLVSSEAIEESHKQVEKSLSQQTKLKALLDVAKTLSGQLHIDELIPSIMLKACDLVGADRCSLFMVNDQKDKLITSFQGGLSKSIAIPITAGIVGCCATTQQILNIKDAYEDPRFNRNTDIETGYRTRTLLCVPIFDDDRRIRGVTEMINKVNGTFTQDDEEMMEVFNVFCGLSIENAKLYNASIELTMQLRSILEISQSIAHSTQVTQVLENILRDTRKVVGAATALLYMITDKGLEVIAMNEDIEAKEYREKNQTEEKTQNTKRDMIKEMITGRRTVTKNTNKEEDERLEYANKAILRRIGLMNNNQDPILSLIVSPIFDSEKKNVTGALLMQWKLKGYTFTKTDVDMLESFCIFISLALEKCDLNDIRQQKIPST